MSLLNKISIGTAQFGLNYGINNSAGRLAIEEAEKIISKAQKNGVTSLDTAAAYGDAEIILGKINTVQFDITTKLSNMPLNITNIEYWVLTELEQSLKKLNRDSISGILLHNPESLLKPAGNKIIEALQIAKDQKLINGFGVSIYNPDELDKILDLFELDIVQAPFNIIDRRLETSGWMEKLYDQNIKIQVRSIFLQGLLLIERKNVDARFKKWEPLFQQWEAWLGQNDLTAYEACIYFISKFNKIDRIIVGVDSLKQFNQLIDIGTQDCPEFTIPNISSADLDLINPTRWSTL
jgi:aryl-alcohol dehydrogenase-like predicted oxidoreductase